MHDMNLETRLPDTLSQELRSWSEALGYTCLRVRRGAVQGDPEAVETEGLAAYLTAVSAALARAADELDERAFRIARLEHKLAAHDRA